MEDCLERRRNLHRDVHAVHELHSDNVDDEDEEVGLVPGDTNTNPGSDSLMVVLTLYNLK